MPAIPRTGDWVKISHDLPPHYTSSFFYPLSLLTFAALLVAREPIAILGISCFIFGIDIIFGAWVRGLPTSPVFGEAAWSPDLISSTGDFGSPDKNGLYSLSPGVAPSCT